jgi:hypothetical protein
MIQLKQTFDKLGNPKGVIHIGVQFLYIRPFYLSLGLTNTIWIESNPFFFDLAKKTINYDEKVFNCVIGSEPIVISYQFNEDKKMNTIQNFQFDDLLRLNNIDIENYDFLHIGLQPQFDYYKNIDISKFKYVMIEVAENFDKNSQIESKIIDQYFKENRFKRLEKKIYTNIGAALYVKKRKYTKSDKIKKS